VFQSYALYPHRTVAQNIAFPLEASGMPRPQIAEKVRWAADLFGITRYLERYPRQLSGGERQRVALCRALVRDPKVFLLDEPLANLDAKLRNTARDELKRFQRQIQRTTVYVTHDQVEAMGLGDRIAVMDHGKVRQIGTPQEVYEDPVDTFVATFVGQPPMNLLEVRHPPGTLLGFRPEHFLPRDHFGSGEPVLRVGWRADLRRDPRRSHLPPVAPQHRDRNDRLAGPRRRARDGRRASVPRRVPRQAPRPVRAAVAVGGARLPRRDRLDVDLRLHVQRAQLDDEGDPRAARLAVLDGRAGPRGGRVQRR